jgi:hypothetical protein
MRQANAVTAPAVVSAWVMPMGIIGANPMLGVTAAHDLTIRQANATYIAAKQTAASTQQATIQVAKDLLASQGDTGPR